jgi:hypothetical protein
MDLAIHYLKVIGCEASGLVSDEDLVNAVRSETRARDYDGVILAAGRLGGSGLARTLHLDPVHQLRRRWGKRLIVCQPGLARHRQGHRQGDPRSVRARY